MKENLPVGFFLALRSFIFTLGTTGHHHTYWTPYRAESPRLSAKSIRDQPYVRSLRLIMNDSASKIAETTVSRPTDLPAEIRINVYRHMVPDVSQNIDKALSLFQEVNAEVKRRRRERKKQDFSDVFVAFAHRAAKLPGTPPIPLVNKEITTEILPLMRRETLVIREDLWSILIDSMVLSSGKPMRHNILMLFLISFNRDCSYQWTPLGSSSILNWL